MTTNFRMLSTIKSTRATVECVKALMRLFLSLVILLVFGAMLYAADSPPADFYLQIVRGANDTKSKDASWKPIGPKLAERLKRVVPWEYYWETARQEIAPAKGKPRTIAVSPGRHVEIAWVSDHQVELCMYRNGVLRRKSKVKVTSGMTVVGGDTTGNEGWFVVVRKDKPSVN